jgi:putative membrane protein
MAHFFPDDIMVSSVRYNMKRLIFYAILIGIAGFSRVVGCSPEKDPVSNTNQINDQRAEDKTANRDVARFLVKSADSRLVGAEEGQLAVEKGASTAVRSYGQRMVRDQEKLWVELKTLAVKKNVALPPGISNKKEKGRDKLEGKTGAEFDKKFIQLMTDEHERDIKLFRNALDSRDPDVRAFAEKYLPMIESHLELIKSIEIPGS